MAPFESKRGTLRLISGLLCPFGELTNQIVDLLLVDGLDLRAFFVVLRIGHPAFGFINGQVFQRVRSTPTPVLATRTFLIRDQLWLLNQLGEHFEKTIGPIFKPPHQSPLLNPERSLLT